MKRTLILFGTLLALSACGRTPIDELKKSVVEECPSKTVEELVTDFVSGPEMELYDSGINNHEYLRAGGFVNYDGSMMPLMLEFKMHLETRKVTLLNLYLDQERQSNDFKVLFVEQMCNA